MPKEEAANETAYRILKDAKKAGAEVIITVCPLCQFMLDTKQRSVEQRYGEEMGIPVLYVTHWWASHWAWGRTIWEWI